MTDNEKSNSAEATRLHQLSDRELSEILAALAAWQYPGVHTDDQLQELATAGGHHRRMDTAELHGLIGRLNREGKLIKG